MDLEGWLHYFGYVELIQIANYEKVYIYDFVAVWKNPQLFKKFCAVLKLILEDPRSIKLYHDCRRDYEAQLYILGIDAVHILDTSFMWTMEDYLTIHQKYYKKIKGTKSA